MPPDILDYPTSQDIVATEGQNLTLLCAATGSPDPLITWRRERGKPLLSKGSRESSKFITWLNNLHKTLKTLLFSYLGVKYLVQKAQH